MGTMQRITADTQCESLLPTSGSQDDGFKAAELTCVLLQSAGSRRTDPGIPPRGQGKTSVNGNLALGLPADDP